jgi:hypothetical protein
MKLQDQVCTLEQAEKLKELGVSQSGTFWYADGNPGEIFCVRKGDTFKQAGWGPVGEPTKPYPNKLSVTSAFTVAELGVMCHDDHDVYDASVYYSNHLGCWMWQIMEQMLDEFEGNGIPWKVTHSDHGEYDYEAEARAAMLIYCIENNLFTVEEVNERLTQ